MAIWGGGKRSLALVTHTLQAQLLLLLYSNLLLPCNGRSPLFRFSSDGLGFSVDVGNRLHCSTATTPNMTAYTGWPVGNSVLRGNAAFYGGVFDGASVWLVPYNFNQVIRIDPLTGNMTGYRNWPAGTSNVGYAAFAGGVFDGTSVWLVPHSADRVIKIDPLRGTMIGYRTHGLGSFAFVGGVFDGSSIWLVPHSADRVIKIDPVSGNMTGYSNWPAGTTSIGTQAFAGGVFDGTFVWLVPCNSDRVIRIDPLTGNMTGYDNWPVGTSNIGKVAFASGVFDGTFIWLVPFGADRVIRIDPLTGNMTGYRNWPAGTTNVGKGAFYGGVFDGSSIWLVPFSADRVIRIDPVSGNMTGYGNWPSGTVRNPVFAGGVFDGSSIWLVPYYSNGAVKIRRNCNVELPSVATSTVTASKTTPAVSLTTTASEQTTTLSKTRATISWNRVSSTKSLSFHFSPYKKESKTQASPFDPAQGPPEPSRPRLMNLSASPTVQYPPNVAHSLSRTVSHHNNSLNSSSPVSVQVSILDSPTKALIVACAVATGAASALASSLSAGGSGTDLQTVLILGTLRCNNSFLKGLSDEGDAAIVPLRFGPKPLDGLLGLTTIQGAALGLHLTIAAVAFRLMRWESLTDGLRRTGFPSGSIAFCSSLHQGAFFEVLRLWAGDVPATAGELGGSIGLFIVVMGPPLWIVIWSVTAMRENFVRYQHAFRSMPTILKSAVLPVGYWTAEQRISPMLRSGFGNYLSRPLCLFGLTGVVRAFVAAAVSVLGKNLDCAMQTWIIAGTLIGTALLSLILRPFNTRLTVILTTLSSLLTASVTVLSQFPGMNKVVQWLTVALTGTTLVGTVLLFIVRILTIRWRARERKMFAEHGAVDCSGIPLNYMSNSFSDPFVRVSGSSKMLEDNPQSPNCSFRGPSEPSSSVSSPLLQILGSTPTSAAVSSREPQDRRSSEASGAGYNPLLA